MVRDPLAGAEEETKSYLYKVLVVGDPGVGKTSLVKRYCDDVFAGNYQQTIGVDFNSRALRIGNSEIQAQLWDIAGQEMWGQMTRVYYKSAVGAVVVCDAMNETSLVNSMRWKADIDSKVQLPHGAPIPCLLVANKCDLKTPGTGGVDRDSLSAIVEQSGFVGYAEVSALEGTNVEDAFLSLVNCISKISADESPVDETSADCINLMQTQQRTSRSTCCGV
ncbi:Ras-related protein Rab-32A [Diplonema papillatum]|nr:Ras-related protein Rab-32A [Diplonema papillatum]